jgi:hypothetical protein
VAKKKKKKKTTKKKPYLSSLELEPFTHQNLPDGSKSQNIKWWVWRGVLISISCTKSEEEQGESERVTEPACASSLV